MPAGVETRGFLGKGLEKGEGWICICGFGQERKKRSFYGEECEGMIG